MRGDEDQTEREHPVSASVGQCGADQSLHINHSRDLGGGVVERENPSLSPHSSAWWGPRVEGGSGPPGHRAIKGVLAFHCHVRTYHKF